VKAVASGRSRLATERFLARLGRGREEFLREHFATAWEWYGRLTSLCTAGRVHAWRERCVTACGIRPGDRVLDVATGPGPLLLRAAQELGSSGLGVGLDLSREGLIVARAAGSASAARLGWVQGKVLPLPFRDGSFDVVLVGFALRHLGSPTEVLRELRRVLVPGGRLGILDFLRPRPGPGAWAGLAYLFWIVPVLAGLLSRRWSVYRLARYLPVTILDALRPEELRQEMRASGFGLDTEHSLCAGIVWLFAGRPLPDPAQSPARGERASPAVVSTEMGP